MKKCLIASLLSLMFSNMSWAGTWSTCQTVTAVSNYIAYSNSVIVVLSPGVPGCSSDAPGAVIFRVGQMYVTADSIKTLLASATAAQLSGRSVMVYYDESTSVCWANVVSVGGFAGQCP